MSKLTQIIVKFFDKVIAYGEYATATLDSLKFARERFSKIKTETQTENIISDDNK